MTKRVHFLSDWEHTPNRFTTTYVFRAGELHDTDDEWAALAVAAGVAEYTDAEPVEETVAEPQPVEVIAEPNEAQ